MGDRPTDVNSAYQAATTWKSMELTKRRNVFEAELPLEKGKLLFHRTCCYCCRGHHDSRSGTILVNTGENILALMSADDPMAWMEMLMTKSFHRMKNLLSQVLQTSRANLRELERFDIRLIHSPDQVEVRERFETRRNK